MAEIRENFQTLVIFWFAVVIVAKNPDACY